MVRTTLVALLTSLAGFPQQVPASSPATPAQAPAIQYVPPPFELPRSLRDSIQFGWIAVPQDHNDAASGALRLALSVLPARAADPEPDPIVFIPGGPGLAAVEPWTVEAARSPRIALLRASRDFIILDPRGHGLSQPRTCPALNGAVPLTADSPAAEAAFMAELRACRARLEADGFRTGTLSAVQAAHDIEMLRRALGVKQINLFGASYGTRIVAEVLRLHGAAVRSVIFLSPLPPGLPHLGDDAAVASEVLPTLFRRCTQVLECRTAFPYLSSDYDSVITRIRREPIELHLPETLHVTDNTFRIDEVMLTGALAQLLTTRSIATGAPMVIHTLAHHGFDAVAPTAAQLFRILNDDDVAYGTNLAFHCNDSRTAAETVAWLHTRCPVWVGEEFGDRNPEPLRSDVPALIMVGEFDPRTPPSYARHLAIGLSSSRIIDVPWHGHDLQHPCISRIQRDFLHAPGVLPNTACLDSLPILQFAADVVPSRWVASVTIRAAANPLILAFAGLPTALLLTAVVGLPVHAWSRRNRPMHHGHYIQHVLVWATAATAITMLISTAAAIWIGGRQSLLLPAIGVPVGWSWVARMPWLLLALTTGMVALTSRRLDQTDRLTRLLLLSGMAGAVSVVALWAYLSAA